MKNTMKNILFAVGVILALIGTALHGILLLLVSIVLLLASGVLDFEINSEPVRHYGHDHENK